MICDFCGKEFDTKKGLDTHIGKKHPTEIKKGYKYVPINMHLWEFLKDRKRGGESWTSVVWRLIDRERIKVDDEVSFYDI